MSAETVMKAARDLAEGDVMVLSNGRHLVLEVTKCGNRVEVETALLGNKTHGNERIFVNTFVCVSQFTVELPVGLTPVQQAAETLLKYARDYLTVIDANGGFGDTAPALRALLDELEPPKPPTIEEAADLLRTLRGRVMEDQGVSVADIDAFLARVPK